MFDQTMKTAADAYFGQMKKAFDGLSATPGTLAVAPAIREFTERQSETVKARLSEAQKTALDAAKGIESAMVAAAGFGAGFVRSAVEGAVANATMVVDAARDMAAAKDPQDALRRQAEFVKAFGEANLARAKESLVQVRDAATDGAKVVQAEAEKLVARASKAA